MIDHDYRSSIIRDIVGNCSHGHGCVLALSVAASAPVPSQHYVPLLLLFVFSSLLLSLSFSFLSIKQYKLFALFRDLTLLELVIPLASLAHSDSRYISTDKIADYY